MKGKGIRITARTISAVYVGLILFIGAAELLAAQAPFTSEGLVLLILQLAAIATIVWSWFKEIRGGAALMLVSFSLAIFALNTAGHNHWLAVTVAGGPVFVIAVLFIVSGLINMFAQIPEK